MAPRLLQDIFTNLSEDVVGNYILSIEEIYSHPKDDISKTLDSFLGERDVAAIRERLYQEFLKVIPVEKLREAKIIKASDPSPVYPVLRRRYRVGQKKTSKTENLI